jgi:prepilin-type N-terminal cleavage/methylation domain-containing protein
MRRLRRLVSSQGGYSLIELVTVMIILSIILTGVTQAFVSGQTAEVTMNNRFQAQLHAALALGRLRKDVHCASVISPVGAAASITLTQPTGCTGGGGQISWCTVGSGSRYGLYRKAGASCDSAGLLVADYLTSASIFTYTAQVASTSLGKLHVDMPVNITPSTGTNVYDLVDDIVLKNSTRT